MSIFFCEHRGAHRIICAEKVDDDLRHVLLVGEDNPQSPDTHYSLWNDPPGCAGHRLQEHILMLPARQYRAIWRTNLCCPTWDRDAAILRTFELVAADCQWTTIVMLGRRVASAFQAGALGFNLEPFEHSGVVKKYGREIQFVSLPHPSGRCREWNNTTNYERARRLLRRITPIPFGGVSGGADGSV